MSMMEHEARIAAENSREYFMRDNAKLRRVIQATHKRAVEHKDCDVQHCPICEGGLFQCADCGAAEIEAEERVCTGPKLEYYKVDRFDASAIMFSLDGREPKPSEKGAWVRASDHDELASRTAVLERFRPHWAQGYSSDSIAAQAQTAALSQIWEHLGATSQTEAMQKLAQKDNDLAAEQADNKRLRKALADLDEAFCNRHGSFPLDRTNANERLWNTAMLQARAAQGSEHLKTVSSADETALIVVTKENQRLKKMVRNAGHFMYLMYHLPTDAHKLVYTNYRGETSTRLLKLARMTYTQTKWYPETQLMLKAFDIEKNAYRDFAVADFDIPEQE